MANVFYCNCCWWKVPTGTLPPPAIAPMWQTTAEKRPKNGCWDYWSSHERLNSRRTYSWQEMPTQTTQTTLLCCSIFISPRAFVCVFFTRSFSFNYKSVGKKILIATHQIFTTWAFGWRAYCNYTLTWWCILLTLGEKKSTWMCSSSEERNWKAPCSHTQLTQLCVHKRSQTKTSN